MKWLLIAFFLSRQSNPELTAVLQRATDYVTAYEAELGNVIATEDYFQNWTNGRQARRGQRRTSSDVLIIRVGKEWTALRKVNRVDGSKVKKAEQTFGEAFDDSPADNMKRLVRMKEESTQYNLGDVLREINLPTFALKILHEEEIWRFSFDRVGTEKVDGVLTWVIRFNEKGTKTLVHGNNGEMLHSTGTLWIEPDSGRILKTELSVENPYTKPAVKANTVVTYANGKTVDMLVPRRMVERYQTSDSVIDCEADYSNYHRFEVNVKFDFGPTKPN